MNELTRPLSVIETEINFYKNQTVQSIIELGRKQIGLSANLKSIANHVGPQFGMTGEQCLDLLIHMKGGKCIERTGTINT